VVAPFDYPTHVRLYRTRCGLRITAWRVIRSCIASEHLSVFPQAYVSLAEHCQYKYLLHLGGHTYSNRLKWLMLCNSTVVIPRDHRGWEEFFYSSLLRDGVNVVFADSVENEQGAWKLLEVRVVRRTDGQMDRRTDGWMGRWTDSWADGRADGRICRLEPGDTDEQTDRHTDDLQAGL
jgi:Glycosyl transferase family 90